MNFVDFLGMAAGVLTTAAYLPQVIKTWQTKSVGDFSLFMLFILAAGVLLWFVYGLCIHSFPVIIANGFTFALVLVMVLMKLQYGRNV